MSDLKSNRELDFSPAHRTVSIQQLSRPSLSYWQDAWIRLKKNKRALASMYIIIAILAFTILGPFVWTMDPAKQDLTRISQGPTFGQTALVIDDSESWDGVILEAETEESEDVVEQEEVNEDGIPAPQGLKVFDTPTTQSVKLVWEKVPGAESYAVYRSIQKPEDRDTLGIPLGETPSGDHVSYEDRLKLEPVRYYYSVVSSDGYDESELYQTIEVDVRQAILLSEAQSVNPDVKIGDEVSLPNHPLGTDYLGRDMLARLMGGARVSLFIGFVAPVLYILFGTFFGGLAGYVGGKVDNYMMRFADFVVALPFLLFMILFGIVFGVGPGESGIFPMLVALVVLLWPSTARLVRGQILQLREEGFVQAAKLLGARPVYLLVRHMIPNTMGVILVTLTFAIPSAIFTEAFLSFIGLGVAPPTPSWGSMCNEGIKTMLHSPHELIFPAVMISVTVLAFNLFGDGLRDALDARMRSRE